MVCFVCFALIIQVPTKSKGEPIIPFVAMCWIHLMFVLVKIFLKLKSEFRIIHKVSTHPTISRSSSASRFKWK
jgi:hypothetical protein